MKKLHILLLLGFCNSLLSMQDNNNTYYANISLNNKLYDRQQNIVLAQVKFDAQQNREIVVPIGTVINFIDSLLVKKNLLESAADISSATCTKFYNFGQKIIKHKPFHQWICIGGNMLAAGHLIYGLNSPFLNYAYALKWLTIGFLSSSIGSYNTDKDIDSAFFSMIISLSAGAMIGFFGAIAAGHIK